MNRLTLLFLIATAGWLAPRFSEAAPQVNHILGDLFTEENIPLTKIFTYGNEHIGATSGTTIADPLVGRGWSFAETNIDGLSMGFDNNRHEFRLSEDGVNPITLNGDVSWQISFDIQLHATVLNPAKAFNFSVFGGSTFSSGNPSTSNVNLTTNGTPRPNGLNGNAGESSIFGGNYGFTRTIGSCDDPPGPPCDSNLVLNPDVNYVSGPETGGDAAQTVNIKLIHHASQDGGATPSTIEHIYDDGSPGAPYSSGVKDFRTNGPPNPSDPPNKLPIFIDGYELGFIMQGIAHSGTPTDSYGVNISNLLINIGGTGLPGDYNSDGTVDARDYTVWRDHLGAAGPMGDGTGPNLLGTPDGVVDEHDFEFWKLNFGKTAPAASLALAIVPEPASWIAVFGWGIMLFLGHQRAFRGNQKKSEKNV